MSPRKEVTQDIAQLIEDIVINDDSSEQSETTQPQTLNQGAEIAHQAETTAPTAVMPSTQKVSGVQQTASAPSSKKLTPAQKIAAAKKATALKKLEQQDAKTAAVVGSQLENSLAGMKPTAHISRKLGSRPEDLPAPSFESNGETIFQTSPPTIPVTKFYTPDAMPEGKFQFYGGDHSYRTTSEEMKEKDMLREEQIHYLRQGAEIHRQVRQDIQKYLVPGVRLYDVANQLEKSTLDLVERNGFERTRAFPTGLSLNHIAAHWSPNPTDTKVFLAKDDVLKVDFGVSIQGHIIDSAWTTHFNPIHDPLVEAVKNATETGIRTAGIDVRMCDIGAAVSEVLESYEVEVKGKTLGIKPIRNLCGHSIGHYRIHAGHYLPSYDNRDQTKMTEGTLYALEIFGTTDPLGKIRDEGDCSHYMLNYDVKKPLPRTPEPAIKLWNLINERFSTLAFCRRWLVEEGAVNHSLALNQLVQSGAVDACPPLVVRKGYQTAQFEHTFLVGSSKKEVFTPSWDY